MSTVPDRVTVCSFSRDGVPKTPRDCSYSAVKVYLLPRNFRFLVLFFFFHCLNYSFAFSEQVPGDYERAFDQNYVSGKWRNEDINRQITSAEYKSMLTVLIAEMAPDKLEWFNSRVTDHDCPLTRELGILMSWYAAVCVDAYEYNYTSDYNPFDRDAFGEDNDSIQNMIALMPFVVDSDHASDITDPGSLDHTMAMFWNPRHVSSYSNEHVISFDRLHGNMNNLAAFTVADAVCAVTRIWDSSEKANFTEIDNPEAVRSTISAEVIQKAAGTEIKTINELPRLTGFVLMKNFGFGEKTIEHSKTDISRIAEWGFSCVRLNVTYETFFSEDLTQANLTQLQKLDNLVSAAVENNIHLNLCLMTLPGRTRWYNDQDYTGGGDFDLFVNKEKQDLSAFLWSVLAERYKDIPGAYLSFTPFWEASNPDLSTGTGAPSYNQEDVIQCLDTILNAIREKDPNRFIIYEMNCGTEIKAQTAWTKPAIKKIGSKYDNTLISYNYADGAYVYAQMTGNSGEDIDRMNHSMFRPEYPTYVYAAKKHLEGPKALTINGFLPAGTQIHLFVEKTAGCVFTVHTKQDVLYTETIQEAIYNKGAEQSLEFPFARSDKELIIPLEKNEETLYISCENGWMEWCGMNVVLPEEFAVERWYIYSGYDAFLDGDPEKAGNYLIPTSTITISPHDTTEGSIITICKDISYTTESILDQASPQTISEWTRETASLTPYCIVRFENAGFSGGATQASMLRYYEDMLKTWKTYGFGWLSNDYVGICSGGALGAKLIEYDGFSNFNIDLLELLQRYQ